MDNGFMARCNVQMGENMKDYTLAQQYAIIGLNDLESNHDSMAKSAVIRGIPVAQFLEDAFLKEENEGEEFTNELLTILKEIKRMGRKEAKRIETEMVSGLMGEGVIEEIPDILACDFYNASAGVSIKGYRSEESIYQNIIEGIRAEVLEEGPITAECFSLLWLFRETGLMHDLFTVAEQEMVEQKAISIAVENRRYQIIWQEEFHSSLGKLATNYLHWKKNLFKNPYLEGINLMYPFLERRQAIFVESVIFGTTVKERRLAVLSYLSERGHYVTEVKNGSETLLKVDNQYYRIFPSSISCRFPIQGMRLVPVYR